MRVNEHTALATAHILLVPYTSAHVPTYHTWMADSDLQSATASEPLSLDEEYEMQASWREDPDKLTFIACLPLPTHTSSPSAAMPSRVEARVDDDPGRMIGDINLFLFDVDEEEHESGHIIGEIELMIARRDLHRHGYGRAALLAFMQYILSHWSEISMEFRPLCEDSSRQNLAYLRVKINQTNVGSISLFESVGFKIASDGPNYFGEVELRWWPTSTALAQLKDHRGWQEVRALEYS